MICGFVLELGFNTEFIMDIPDQITNHKTKKTANYFEMYMYKLRMRVAIEMYNWHYGSENPYEQKRRFDIITKYNLLNPTLKGLQHLFNKPWLEWCLHHIDPSPGIQDYNPHLMKIGPCQQNNRLNWQNFFHSDGKLINPSIDKIISDE